MPSGLDTRDWPEIGLAPEVAHRTYAELFSFENQLRHFVYTSLRLCWGGEWLEHLPDEKPDKVRTRAQGHRNEDSKLKYMRPVRQNLVWYVLTNHLVKIMAEEKNWASVFKDRLFKQSQLQSKFEELTVLRNRCAHFKQLTRDDLVRLKNIMLDFQPSLTIALAKYWNADPLPLRDFEELTAAVETGADTEIPVFNGEGGFATREMLRHNVLLCVGGNPDCLWVSVETRNAERGLLQLHDLAHGLGEAPIHIAFTYDPTEPNCLARGIESIRLSYPKTDGVDALAGHLRDTYACARSSRARSSGHLSETVSGTELPDYLFSKFPPTVIVAPVQAQREVYHVVSSDDA